MFVLACMRLLECVRAGECVFVCVLKFARVCACIYIYVLVYVSMWYVTSVVSIKLGFLGFFFFF